jgi:hypothetical protein
MPPWLEVVTRLVSRSLGYAATDAATRKHVTPAGARSHRLSLPGSWSGLIVTL